MQTLTIKLNLDLSRPQWQVYDDPARFRVLVAGRRFGKTHLALAELLRTAFEPGRTAWYVGPTYRQAKRIAWERLKSLVKNQPGLAICETELTIRFSHGSSIALRGADQYDSLRGNGLDFVVLDEFASMKPQVWPEVIRPALADRHGRALFLGTPQGHDHLYDRFQFAHAEPDWAAFQFTTLEGGFVSKEELAGAARELDERLFRQEFEASFESTAVGLAYHAFSRANIRPTRFRPGAHLVWSLDFNVNPMCSVLAQRDGETIEVLEELVLDDANTPYACDRFWNRTSRWRGRGMPPLKIDIYGDASGYQRRTCGSATDWQLIREFFARYVGEASIHIKAASANPGVRDRINTVNSRLLNAAGEHHLFIDPECKELIRDLERICWRTDEFGQPTTELDKSDRMRTHTSDALGYYLAAAFPPYSKIGERSNKLF